MKKHPSTPNKIGQILAKRTLASLFIWFSLCILIASLIIGGLYLVTEPECNPQNYYYWYQEALFVLSTVGASDIQVSGAFSWHGIVNILANFLGLMLPALFLGAIVYRLVTPNQAFIFRNKISSYHHTTKGNVAAIRFYNSTTRPIVNITYDVYARIKETKVNGKKTIKNKKLSIHGRGVWPIASDRVPFTAYIKVVDKDGNKSFITNAGEKILFDNVEEILVLVNGTLRNTSSQVYDSQTYIFPNDKSDSIWVDIDVDIDTDPKKWEGWDSFDET
jgi:hypothetical protein